MPLSFEFCLPTMSASVPADPDWLHEIKYDGYRLRIERNGDRVRLITRGGYDWTKRFPWIVEAALKNRQKHFVIDGEAVIMGVDGYSDFGALHSGRRNEDVQLCAFDVLAMDGADLRKLPLSMRKANLARLLARRPDGIFLSDFEQGEIGLIFSARRSEFGFEGLVSKRRDRPYRAGRSKHWIKGQEPAAPRDGAGRGLFPVKDARPQTNICTRSIRHNRRRDPQRNVFRSRLDRACPIVIRSESYSGRKFAPGDDRQDAAVRTSASQHKH